MRKAENIINKMIRKERTAVWMRFVEGLNSKYDSGQEGEKRKEMLHITFTQFYHNPSSDNFAMLQQAMWMHQDFQKNDTVTSDLLKPEL